MKIVTGPSLTREICMVRTEFPALHPAFQQCGQFLLEPFIEGNGMIGSRGADEGGSVPLFGGSVQRELG